MLAGDLWQTSERLGFRVAKAALASSGPCSMSARHLSLLASFALPALGPAACGARSSLTLSDQQTDAGNESCEPRLGSVERCNGLDDDCDGLVDEDLVIAPLGGPIVVRDAEGSTGVCSTCRWALSPQLRPVKAGTACIVELGFDGASPGPNIYARRLTRTRSHSENRAWSRSSPQPYSRSMRAARIEG